MKRIFVPLFVIVLPWILAGAVSGEDLDQVLRQQAPSSFESCYRPIAPWTGQIILPQPKRREADGAVPFLVFSSPRKDLVGRIIRLAWNTTQPGENWFTQARPDVVFDRRKQSIGEKAGCRFPTQLDGWRAVSALESLPANRSEGTIEVILKDPVFQHGTAYVSREPVQVNGAVVCLARFEGPAEGNLRLIRHYNPQSRQFDGPAEVVTIMPPRSSTTTGPRQTSTDRIERAYGNIHGWYLYGKRGRNGFLVKSIEPRGPLMLVPTRAENSPKAIKAYVHDGLFEGLQEDQTRASLFEPRPGFLKEKTPDAMAEYARRVWPVGTRALLIHLFGWRKVDGERPGFTERLGLVTGHFSFGIAEVVTDPFTGEPRWDIEYKQVYGHNREEVVSGSMKWHAYMGNLRRGWMYSIPVWDTIVQIPELQPYAIGSWRMDPLQGFARELERMMALYRVGGGSGCSIVRPDVSCVQDSHCGLYAALQAFFETVSPRPETRNWLQKLGPADPEVKRFQRLQSLAEEVRRMITSPLGPQGNWKQFVEEPLGTRDPLGVRTVLDLLLSARTVFPRFAHERMLNLAADRGYPMWNIMTVQTGGQIPGITPQAPTSPTVR